MHESETEESAVSELRKRLGISVSLPSNGVPVVDELEDRELIELASSLVGERDTTCEHISHIQALRDHWRNCTARFIPLKELGPLLRDYQRQITRRHLENGGSDPELVESGSPGKVAYGFYHIRNVNQLRMDDIPKLLAEYKQLLN
ncbi:hypothetical protein RchiOBHm_Chr1g0333991 [Rosa chinensis]|uniref:Uncharacterized protein n=1 Tax=Rosa chinensis TaxID=74649 RepID=A0A2P6SC82_ROSCH|nr:hypothetical protein RchiOBHm_Chr1g0333991 [Rosa chinensis]